MCGIVGAVGKQNVLPILLNGLKRLEYRGYDSAGVAVINGEQLVRTRSVGRIKDLERALNNADAKATSGATGIAHTRWATHGAPTEYNAHPHTGGEQLALVCNGIVENHESLRDALIADGDKFSSDTDTEVIVKLIAKRMREGLDLFDAVQQTTRELDGAYAIGVVHASEPSRLIGARRGSPLVVGIGDGETFIASDMAALIGVTRDFYILEDGDIADIRGAEIRLSDAEGRAVARKKTTSNLTSDAIELGDYSHYMHKEIHQQSAAIAATLEGRITGDKLLEACFGARAGEIFDAVRAVRIIACGSSYYAGMVGKYWLEEVGVPCQVEIASEFRSRAHAITENCLLVTLSQSGETLDTLAALAFAKQLGFAHSLAICNVAESSLVRESELALLTHAGLEIGVASTKAFTAQMVALRLLAIALGRRFDLRAEAEAGMVAELRQLPVMVARALSLEPQIKELAEQFADKQHALFLGRGAHFPIALEGALKLKEISYIHAEAYPAGELKHGPLALVDAQMPVVSVAPNDKLLGKLKANIAEVRARGAKLFVFADSDANMRESDNLRVINVAAVDSSIAPIIFVIPLQLLAYHVALIKGTDVDKPRNLAKSVTVE